MNLFYLVLISTIFILKSESKPIEPPQSTLSPTESVEPGQKLVNVQQLVYFNGIVPQEDDQGLLNRFQEGAGPIFIKFNGDQEPTILDYSENQEKTEALINNTIVLGRYFYRFLRTLYRAGAFLVSFIPRP